MYEETPQGDVLLSFQDQVFLFITGEVDLACGPRLLALTRALLDSGASSVVLDLSAVSFLDCAGLEQLIAVTDRLRAAGRTVSVPSPSAVVIRLLEQTSMTHVVTSLAVTGSVLSA